MAIKQAEPSALAVQQQGHYETDLQYQARGCAHCQENLSSRTLTPCALISS